ncbi:hypothetical protein PINS_up004730 [Pythium insidiosum]|nr:hypothetical protein PINS_up004730 [Pythium insidiosum]
MWGFSPAFNLLERVKQASQQDENEPVNLLLIGPGDIRHVLHTVARRRRHASKDAPLRPLHIYVYERSVETLARHLLLWAIAQDWDLPLRQRCNTFLEVFGNALVQERTASYIETKSKELMELLYYERGWLADQIDLSHLKMKTRDELVDTLRSWSTNVRFDGTCVRRATCRGDQSIDTA